MLPFRDHLAAATPGLVLVIPVVVGTIAGGLYAGLVAVVVGSRRLRPRLHPAIRDARSRKRPVLVHARRLRGRHGDRGPRRGCARQGPCGRRLHETEARRLFELSELVVEERLVAELLETIVVTVQSVFGTRGVALLLPVDDRLEVVASSGESDSRSRAGGPRLVLRSCRWTSGRPWRVVDELRAVCTFHSRSARSVFSCFTKGAGLDQDRELLRTFANHMAIALERAQLRQTALRVGTLEEVDRLRRSLVSAVSHDLRTPLATIKVACRACELPTRSCPETERTELLGLVEAQADRLDRLVTNLLDMTRIQAGVFEPRHQSVSVAAIVDDAVGALGPANGPADLCVELPDDLPLVDVDRLLVGQVFANLLENAGRFAPDGTPVTVRADGDCRMRSG